MAQHGNNVLNAPITLYMYKTPRSGLFPVRKSLLIISQWRYGKGVPLAPHYCTFEDSITSFLAWGSQLLPLLHYL